MSAKQALSDGEAACTGLAKQDDSSGLTAMLTRRGLTDFESYVVTVFAGQYLCPKEYPREAADMQQALQAGT